MSRTIINFIPGLFVFFITFLSLGMLNHEDGVTKKLLTSKIWSSKNETYFNSGTFNNLQGDLELQWRCKYRFLSNNHYSFKFNIKATTTGLTQQYDIDINGRWFLSNDDLHLEVISLTEFKPLDRGGVLRKIYIDSIIKNISTRAAGSNVKVTKIENDNIMITNYKGYNTVLTTDSNTIW